MRKHEKYYKIFVRVYNGGNNDSYAHSIYDCFYVSWKKKEEGILCVGIVLFYPSGKQCGAISKLVNIERL